MISKKKRIAKFNKVFVTSPFLNQIFYYFFLSYAGCANICVEKDMLTDTLLDRGPIFNVLLKKVNVDEETLLT